MPEPEAEDSSETSKCTVPEHANCLSRLFFVWVHFVFEQHPQRGAEGVENREPDRAVLPQDHSASRVLVQFDRLWDAPAPQRSLSLTIKRVFRGALVRSGVLLFLQSAFQLAVPLFIEPFLEWLQEPDATGRIGWPWVAGAVLCIFVGNAICGNHAVMALHQLGIDMQSLFHTLAYRKMLHLDREARGRATVWDDVAAALAASQRLPMNVLALHWLWLGPISILALSTVLLMKVGAAALGGLAVLFVSVFLTLMLGDLQMKAVSKQSECREQRRMKSKEGLHCIMCMKYQAWEEAYSNKLAELRSAEVSTFRPGGRAQALSMVAITATPVLATLVMLASLSLEDAKQFRPATIFTSLTLLHLLRQPLPMLVAGVKAFVEINAALVGLQRLLLLSTRATDVTAAAAPDDKCGCLELSGASFQWRIAEDTSARGEIVGKSMGSESGFLLQDISMKASAGQLCVVAGGPGSGKSSLLQALLGEMPQSDSSTVTLRGSVAYCAQAPWLQSATLKDNVVFGRAFERSRYVEALEMCCLSADFAALSDTDLTVVGGGGLTDSQRIRVALARACYSRSAVYLLDGVLADMDSKTSAWLVEKCLRKLVAAGALVVVTLTLGEGMGDPGLLALADRIWLLKGGQIVENGTLGELQSIKGGALRALLAETEPELRCDSRPWPMNLQVSAKPVPNSDANGVGQLRSQQVPSLQVPPPCDLTTRIVAGCVDVEQVGCAANLGFMAEGLRAKRPAQPPCSLLYFCLVTCPGGCCWSLLATLLLAATQGSRNVLEWWISAWSDAALNDGESGQNYVGIFALLASVAIVLAFLRSALVFRVLLRCAKTLHDRLLRCVMAADVSLFEDTPFEKVVDMFGKDTDDLDIVVQRCAPLLLITAFEATGLVLTIACIIPLVFIPLLLLLAPYCYFLQKWFRPVDRELLWLERMTRSSAFMQVRDSLAGLPTIRAFGSAESFMGSCMERVDLSSQVSFLLHSLHRWLQLRLELLGILLVISVACLGALGSASAGIAGLAFFYAQVCVQYLSLALRQAAEVEGRIGLMSTLGAPPEAEALEEESQKPNGWPQSGRLECREVSARYRTGTPMVLHNVSVTLEAGVKVGLCGPPGGGKSTFLKVLFRVLDIYPRSASEARGQGTVFLDGLDVRTVGVRQLRRAMTMIPQDPVMFLGTMGENLDLLGEFGEERLTSALALVGLPDSLTNRVEEGGSTFSQGQRQLLCLARALLRRPLVLCLEDSGLEADDGAEEKLMSLVKTQFPQATVVTTVNSSRFTPAEAKTWDRMQNSHRLRWLAESDRILFMLHGRAAEYDAPGCLLSNSSGRFYGFVRDLGSACAWEFCEEVQKATFSAAPLALRVECPNGQGECSGLYLKVAGDLPNGRAVWKQEGGQRWMYFSNFSTWTVGGTLAKERAFACSTGWLYNKVQSILGPEQAPGQWMRWSAGKFVPDESITVTTLDGHDHTLLQEEPVLLS